MRELRKVWKCWSALCMSLVLLGCAPMIATAPASIGPLGAGESSRTVKVLAPVDVKFETGYSRKLAGQSTWKPVGRLPQGTVYRPVGTIFTIEGRQVHEAYLVIREKTLVGFYLPGEQNYSPLSNVVPLTLGESE